MKENSSAFGVREIAILGRLRERKTVLQATTKSNFDHIKRSARRIGKYFNMPDFTLKSSFKFFL